MIVEASTVVPGLPPIVKLVEADGGRYVALIPSDGPFAGREVFRSDAVFAAPTGTENPPELVKYLENGLVNGFTAG